MWGSGSSPSEKTSLNPILGLWITTGISVFSRRSHQKAGELHLYNASSSSMRDNRSLNQISQDLFSAFTSCVQMSTQKGKSHTSCLCSHLCCESASLDLHPSTCNCYYLLKHPHVFPCNKITTSIYIPNLTLLFQQCFLLLT